MKTDFTKYGILPEKGRDYENIAYVMALIYNVCEKKIDKFLAEYGLTLVKYNALLIVRFQSGDNGINQAEIGKRLIVTPGNMTKIISALSSEDLIEVRQNKNNRRENLVSITKKGDDLIEKIWPDYDILVKSLIDFVPKKQQSELSNILADWFTKLQTI